MCEARKMQEKGGFIALTVALMALKSEHTGVTRQILTGKTCDDRVTVLEQWSFGPCRYGHRTITDVTMQMCREQSQEISNIQV